LVAETHGVLLRENTLEAIAENISAIDELDPLRLMEPLSLDEESTIIAKALSEAS